jgi:hypothetical protein
MVGEKFEGSGSSFGKHYGSCLLSPLNMAHVCVLSYSWVIFLSLSHTNPMSHHTPSTLTRRVPQLSSHYVLVYLSIESMLPSLFLCLTMFKGSFNPNQPLCSITNLHPRVSLCSFNPLSYITFLCQFCVDDGGNIMALLRRVYSCRLQHIIQELDLETS